MLIASLFGSAFQRCQDCFPIIIAMMQSSNGMIPIHVDEHLTDLDNFSTDDCVKLGDLYLLY